MSMNMTAVAWDSQLGSTQKLVLLALASMTTRRMVLGLTVADLCRMTGLSDRCVQKAMNGLEKAGYLHRHFIDGEPTAYELLQPGVYA